MAPRRGNDNPPKRTHKSNMLHWLSQTRFHYFLHCILYMYLLSRTSILHKRDIPPGQVDGSFDGPTIRIRTELRTCDEVFSIIFSRASMSLALCSQGPAQIEDYHTGLLRTPAPAAKSRKKSGKDHNPGADWYYLVCCTGIVSFVPNGKGNQERVVNGKDMQISWF